MKRVLPLVLLSCLVATGAMLALASRTSSAATPGLRNAASFVRPQFDPPGFGKTLVAQQLDTLRAQVDLTRYSTIGRRQALSRLSANRAACYAALDDADVGYVRVAATRNATGCGYNDALRLERGLVAYASGDPFVMTCAQAARLHLWERQVVAPAAEKHLGSALVEIVAFGAFSCRRIQGVGRLSEHAYGRAADIKAFRLADGRTITVLDDFRSKGSEGAFLREIRDRACDVFDVTLSPDHDADHANHFHLDVGGEHICR